MITKVPQVNTESELSGLLVLEKNFNLIETITNHNLEKMDMIVFQIDTRSQLAVNKIDFGEVDKIAYRIHERIIYRIIGRVEDEHYRWIAFTSFEEGITMKKILKLVKFHAKHLVNEIITTQGERTVKVFRPVVNKTSEGVEITMQCRGRVPLSFKDFFFKLFRYMYQHEEDIIILKAIVK